MATAAAMTGLEAARYTRVAIGLHWLIALLVVGNLVIGLYHDSFGRPAEAWLMFFHKGIGISVLVLTLARLAWRVTHRPPPFAPVLRRWEVGLATVIHWAFYAALIAIPLTGWMVSSSVRKPDVTFFGLFELPPLPVSSSRDAHEQFEGIHEILGKAMIGLLLLHVAGALKHHFEGHWHLIGRMAPWFYRGR